MAVKTFTVGEVLTSGDVNNYLMKQVVIVCTSGTRPSSPPEGMTIYETDTDLLRVCTNATGPAWTTFASIRRELATDRQAGSYTITGTSYGVTTASGTYADCGQVFTAPASGVVTVTYSALLSNSGASSATFVSPVTRTGGTVGSGSSVSVADDSVAIKQIGANSVRFGAGTLLSGLTPGDVYNVRLEHKVDAGTGTIRWRDLIIDPR